MNFWITTHWPPLEGHENVEWRYHIFLPDGREQAGEELRPGDLIFIYESKTGRPLSNSTRKYIVGREGIVALVEAKSRVVEHNNVTPEEYADGSVICWKWQARTEVNRMGFCSRIQVCRALGYNRNYTLRGFGDHRSGLKKLTMEQFDSLNEWFS